VLCFDEAFQCVTFRSKGRDGHKVVDKGIFIGLTRTTLKYCYIHPLIHSFDYLRAFLTSGNSHD